jgi:site-specific DNA-methyltransferase (adenine-specific)
VWTIGYEPFSEAHFAVFPTEIPRLAILAGCPVGGTVIDPFYGAGTTGIVADRLGRHCIGIELNPEYVEIARRRLQRDPETAKGAAARQIAMFPEAAE